nr:hypothetical protein [uncultured Sphingomonas sp.]
MYIVTKERALAQARALSGALALAERAGWTFDRKAPLMLRPPFSNYLHVASAELLLVPSVDPTRRDLAIVDRGMREARCDALVVKASTSGKPMLYCAVGRWRREQNLWCHERRPWLTEHGQVWLVAEHAWAEDAKTSILLGPKRLQVASERPRLSAREMAEGFERADTFLAQIWGIC